MQLILASASKGRQHLLSLLKIPFEILTTDIDEDAILASNPLETIQLRARLKAEEAAERIQSSEISFQNSEFRNLKSDNRILILSADTEVIIGKTLLGKPKDERDATRILQLLSGKTHEVITAIYAIKVDTKVSEDIIRRVTRAIPIRSGQPSRRRLLVEQRDGKRERQVYPVWRSRCGNPQIRKIWQDYDRSLVTFKKLSDKEIKRYLSITDYTRYTGGYALLASAQDFVIQIEGSLSNVIGLPLEKLIPIFEENKLL